MASLGAPEVMHPSSHFAAGLEFDPTSRAGVVLHMLSGLPIDGRIGLTAIARIDPEAVALTDATRQALTSTSVRRKTAPSQITHTNQRTGDFLMRNCTYLAHGVRYETDRAVQSRRHSGLRRRGATDKVEVGVPTFSLLQVWRRTRPRTRAATAPLSRRTSSRWRRMSTSRW